MILSQMIVFLISTIIVLSFCQNPYVDMPPPRDWPSRERSNPYSSERTDSSGQFFFSFFFLFRFVTFSSQRLQEWL